MLGQGNPDFFHVSSYSDAKFGVFTYDISIRSGSYSGYSYGGYSYGGYISGSGSFTCDDVNMDSETCGKLNGSRAFGIIGLLMLVIMFFVGLFAFCNPASAKCVGVANVVLAVLACVVAVPSLYVIDSLHLDSALQ